MKRLTVPAKVDMLYDVFVFVRKTIEHVEMDVLTQNNIKVAVEEIFVNIASYAYMADEGSITIAVSVENDRFIVEFTDNGTPYNPLSKSDPDIMLSADEREIGGLGIFMVKEFMDDIRYRYENGKNILTLKKNI
jgi:anti-sigma regulatory factor (Ser/Thr protein kinase)